MNTLYQLTNDLSGLLPPLVFLWLLVKHDRRLRERRQHAQVAKVKRELVRDLEPPKRVVDWQHVADLERSIYRKTFHHDGVPCCCAKCERKRRPRPRKAHPVAPAATVAQAQRAIAYSTTVQQLRDQRLRIWQMAKALAEDVSAQGRNFTGDERDSWDNYNTSLDAIDQRIKTIMEIEERTERLTSMARRGLGNGRGCLSTCNDPTHVINVQAIGDPEPRYIAATPEHQQYMLDRDAKAWNDDYDRGRDAGMDIIRRIEHDNPPPPAISD